VTRCFHKKVVEYLSNISYKSPEMPDSFGSSRKVIKSPYVLGTFTKRLAD